MKKLLDPKNSIYLKLAAAIFLLVLLSMELGVFNNFEKSMLDLRFRVKKNTKKAAVINYVDIDDYSFQNINEKWPWTRDYYAYLVDALTFAGARKIAFDIFFDVPSTENPQYDSMLISSAKESGHVLLGSFFSIAAPFGTHVTESVDTSFFDIVSRDSVKAPKDLQLYESYNARFPIRPLAAAAQSVGFAQVIPDNDGVTRRYPLVLKYGDRIFFAMGLTMALDYLHVPKENVVIKPGKYILLPHAQVSKGKKEDIYIPVNKKCEMIVNWAGPWRTDAKHYDFPHTSFFDVLSDFSKIEETGEVSNLLKKLDGKYCIIGATATGLHDLNPIPLQARYPMVGAHANVMNTIITRQFIYTVPQVIVITILLLFSIFASLVFPFITPFKSFIAFFLTTVLYIALTFGMFIKFDLWLNLIYPVLYLILAYLTIVVYRYMTEEKEKKVIKNTFQRYVTASVVNVLLNDPEKVKLGGSRKELSVLFSDIRSFTSISESLQPEEVVALLNEYLGAMTDIIFEYEGMLDKYVGDEIMAVYGAPVEQPDHPYKACMTAYKMMQVLHQLQDKWREEGRPVMNIGIGINTGPMIIGNMGSQVRMDYTVMGDAVNLGARLEGTNKIYKTNIIVSEFTYEYVKDKFVFRELDVVRVKGKNKPVKIFELVDVLDNNTLNNDTGEQKH